MKKTTLLFGLIIGASQAFGSYELLMQIDRAATGGPAVRRFDPTSGTYLGLFGQGYLVNPQSIVYRDGVLHVLDVRSTGTGGGRILRFNPSTGEALGMISLSTGWGKAASGSGLTITSTGNYLVSDAQLTSGFSYVNEYAPSGDYLAGRYWSGGTNQVLYGVAFNAAANKIYTANDTTGKIDVFNYTTGTTTAIQSVAAPGGGFNLAMIGNALYYSSNVLSDRVQRALINADGTLQAFTQFDPSIAARINTIGVGGGHSPFAYACQSDSSNQWSFSRFNSVSFDSLGTFGAGVMQSPWGNIEVITAPEPSSLVLITAGLAAVALRRRNRS